MSYTENFNTKNRVSREKRTESRTVRNFTRFFAEEELPEAVSVHLDWLSFMVENSLPEPVGEATHMWLTESVVIEYLKRGTPIFKHSYDVYLHGEKVAMYHTHPKNDKILKPEYAKLEINNQVLYATGFFLTFDEVRQALKIQYIKNLCRMDIALDGANHVHKFLNLFSHSGPGRKEITRRGAAVKMKGKASFDAKRLDRKSMQYQNFKIGSGHKQFTVYNKSKELERSHKEYIRDAWKLAGMDPEAEQWRCELRMTSQSLKEIKGKFKEIIEPDGNSKVVAVEGIDLCRLDDPNYLLQIFKTQCKNFFDFVLIEGDENVSRAREIDLFQFWKLKVALLEKIPRAIVRGAYKAKMAIHNAYANVLMGKYKSETAIEVALCHILDNVVLYNLQRYYEKKKPDWQQLYCPVVA